YRNPGWGRRDHDKCDDGHGAPGESGKTFGSRPNASRETDGSTDGEAQERPRQGCPDSGQEFADPLNDIGGVEIFKLDEIPRIIANELEENRAGLLLVRDLGKRLALEMTTLSIRLNRDPNRFVACNARMLIGILLFPVWMKLQVVINRLPEGMTFHA